MFVRLHVIITWDSKPQSDVFGIACSASHTLEECQVLSIPTLVLNTGSERLLLIPYLVSVLDSNPVSPRTSRDQYVVGWFQEECQPGDDPGNDENWYVFLVLFCDEG